MAIAAIAVSILATAVFANADAVTDWNAIAVDTFVANKQNPFAQARYGAIVQVAVFEAVNAITGDYQPYLGTITAPPGASAEAAAIEAAYGVLNAYFPSAGLDAARANSLAQIPDGQAKIDGIVTGDAAADTELPSCEWNRSWNPLSMAVRNSVRHLKRQ
jgi:hypothetical protein